tara:strand:- start:32373 stop:33509 length:1137 start_codon:yes stop_codon:yes gene_type:complete
MNSFTTLQKYKKNKILYNIGRPHQSPRQDSYKYFIIIPSFSESDYIFDTLNTISNQNPDLLLQTLIVIVINNAERDSLQIKKNNQQTYDMLLQATYPFEMIVIDCFSEQNALDDLKAGVGLARKIGYDYCIQYAEYTSLFLSLDADTLIHQDYLLYISDYFLKYKNDSAVVNFQHQSNDNIKIQKAILEYEKLLKNIAYQIQLTGSPYGFVSMGSTIICTMNSYIAVGGMSIKKATEDFYFLQKLAKYSKVHRIETVLVYPSSRPETRVYLGTGFRMSNIHMNHVFDDLYINPEAYLVLKYFFNIIIQCWNHDIKEILLSVQKKSSKLYDYLEKENFINAFKKIQDNSNDKKQLLSQFHIWFDNLKLYKFLKLYVNEN